MRQVMGWALTGVFMIVLAALLLAQCASGPVAPTPLTRPTRTPWPTFTPTATLTPSPTPTPTPSAIALARNAAVPESVAEVLLAGGEVRMAGPGEQAQAELVLSTEPTTLEWVLVPVVPFPTLADELSWDDVLSYWRGDTEALTYLSDTGEVPTLYCTVPVLSALRALLGDPHPEVPIVVADVQGIVESAWETRPASWAIVPFDELEPRWKVLRLDAVSVLERGLAEQEYPLRLHFQLVGPRASKLALPSCTNRDEERMTILVMTGVTALVRGTAARMEQYGVLYPAEEVGPLLRSADITHISNEVPFAENCPFPNMRQESLVFCSDPRYIELLREVGTDVVELTGNHFQDWGPEATRLTVKMYQEEGWPHYGGGVDLEDAQKPIVLTDHGNSISFVGCNPVGPAYAWAAEDYPGAAPCDFDYMHAELGKLREEVDVPIVTWQYWEFYHYEPTPQQQDDFRGMVDAGARIVSGSQAHHPQAIEFYNGGFIHYGLGNLFFDQMWSLGTRQQCIDRHVIYQGRHISTEIHTYMLEDYARPRPMTEAERRELLQALFRASGW